MLLNFAPIIILPKPIPNSGKWQLTRKAPNEDRNMSSEADRLKAMPKMCEVQPAILPKQKHGWLPIRKCRKVDGGTPTVSTSVSA